MQEQIIPTNPEDAEAMVPVVPEVGVIQGINATIQIGTTTTGEAGTNASVENVGTPTHAVLNFTIPRGSKGETGESATIEVAVEAEQLPSGSAPTASIVNSGDTHNADYKLTIGIPKGDTGESATIQMNVTATTLSAGSQATATITNSGDSHNANYTLTLGIPRGADGQDGQDGADGQSATIKVGTVTVITLAEGSQATATVTNVGTSRDGEFNFTFGIPEGKKGETGPTGSVKSQYVAELPASGDEDTFYITDKDLDTYTLSGKFLNFTNTQTAGAITDFEMDGDTTQQTYSGKNLINMAQPYRLDVGFYNLAVGTQITASQDGVSAVTQTSDGVFSIALGGTWRGAIYVVELPVGTDYYLSGAIASSSNRISRYTLDENYNIVRNLGNITSSPSPQTLTVQLETGEKYFALAIGSNSQITITATNIMLEKSSSATDYEPYVGGTPAPNPSYPQPISVVTGENVVKVVGKNIFTPTSPTRSVTRNGVTITIDDDGKVTLDGTATANLYPDLVYGIQSNTIVHSTCYQYYGAELQITASLKIVGGTTTATGDSVRYVFNDNGTSVTVRFDGSSTNTTINSAYGLNRVWFNIPNGATYNNFSFYCQLELGSQATSYEAYTAQDYTISLGSLELAKIGTYQDRIYKTGEKWYVEKQVGKVVLDGSETWTATGGGNGYRIDKSDILTTPSTDAAPIVSNYFTVTTFSSIYNATIDYGIANHNSNHWIVLRDKNWTSASDVTTWLGTHNTTAYYALATPTTTEITDQTLIDQLEALASATLNQGVNNTWTEIATGNAMPTLEFNWVEWERYNRHNVYIWNDDIDDWQVIVGAGE